MPLIVVAPRARLDLGAAARWYDRERAGLGGEFVTAVAAAVAGLAHGPERFPVVHGDLRRAPVDRFPYALTFRMVRGIVRVVACTHYRRHPGRWQERR